MRFARLWVPVYRSDPMLDRVAEASLARRLAARVDVLLPGAYAWIATVAIPAAAPGAPTFSRIAALLALLALFLGPLFASKRAAYGRWLGIHLFLGFCVAAWGSLEFASRPIVSEPRVGAFGALGWMLYAFGWGELRGRGRVPEEDPRVLSKTELLPRSAINPSVVWILGFGVLGTLLLVYLAFNVSRPAHAVMAHAIASVVGLLLLSGAVRAALDRIPRSLPGRAERVSASAGVLALLLITLGLGVLYTAVSR